MTDLSLRMCLPPFLKHQSYGFTYTANVLRFTTSSVLLNVWMTHWITRVWQWRTVQFLLPLYVARLKKWCHPGVVQSITLMNIHPTTLPSILTVPASSPSFSPTCVFRISNPAPPYCIHSLPLCGGLSLMLKGFWQRSRLMCVSLLIDSLH